MIQPPPIPKEALEYLDREGFKIPPPPGYIPKPAAASKNPPPGYIPRPTPEKQKESPNEGVDESPAKRLKGYNRLLDVEHHYSSSCGD